MKYCPFCGAKLIDGAVSFCAECGKELPPAHSEATQSESVKKQASKKKNGKKKKNFIPVMSESEVQDDEYDGYYNDVLPADEDRRREGIDKELIKRISIVLAVLFVIIIACVVLMYVF